MTKIGVISNEIERETDKQTDHQEVETQMYLPKFPGISMRAFNEDEPVGDNIG